MKHYAGLDVSLKETSICIVDETGSICREMKAPSHPEDLARVLQDPSWRLARIGLEAGPLSQWLFSGLAHASLPVVCIETRHTKAFLKAQVNKSDRNDARGIAQLIRMGWFRPVHAKALPAQEVRLLLTARKQIRPSCSTSRAASAACSAASGRRWGRSAPPGSSGASASWWPARPRWRG